MYIYEIELQSVPRFLFCCSVTVNNYRNEFKNRSDFLEITVVKQGKILAQYSDEQCVIMPHTLNAVTSDTNCRMSAFNNEVQSHTTVGVNVKYKLTKHEDPQISDISGLKRGRENILLIPRQMSIGEREYTSILSLIKKAELHYNSLYHSDRLRAVADWYELCAEITEMLVNKLDNSKLPPGQKLYAERIRNYISEHLNERINISDLADEIGISEGYMQNLFKSATGKTIIEFANEYKIRTAANMAQSYGLKLKDIAYQLGFDDPAYMSRLFKRVMGISFSELAKKADMQ